MDLNPRDARLTGLAYLGLAITGVAGFLLVRPRLHAEDDPAATLANLIDHAFLARTGIALELGIVLFQAAVAILFLKLFRHVDGFAAGAITAFGLVNATIILASSAFLMSALGVAQDAAIAPGADAAATVQLMYGISENLWSVGGVFFGLWLLPMGWLAVRARETPDLLGWILLIGGAGYVLSTFAAQVIPDAGIIDTVLTIPATIGEFWMVGYLLWRGIRRQKRPDLTPSSAS